MKVSVLIPSYNASRTIRASLESVLQQSVPPDEILVLDDGSTDDTLTILNSYKPRITILQERHNGVARARNLLCERAQGDLIAFLDSDDIWHPSYLRMQRRLFEDYPRAVAFFTGHVNFSDHKNYQWIKGALEAHADVELMPPLSFFKRYNESTGPFASMSYCCVSKRVLMDMGGEPFSTSLNTAEDCYFFCLLATLGPVVYASVPLVAYRVSQTSLSSNRLKNLGAVVQAFELLEHHYRDLSDERLLRAFRIAFASRRRQYAKILMGAGKTPEARRQLWYSFKSTTDPKSIAKSTMLLFLTHMPARLQPKWLPSYRELKVSQTESKETETYGPPQAVETLTTLEDLERIRDVWSKLQWTASSDIDFFKTIVASQAGVTRPHVVLLKSGDIPRAIMVGRLEETRLNFKVGYRSIFRPRARVLTVVGGGLMGDVSGETSAIFVRELLRVLRNGEADVVFFENVKLDSALYAAVRSIPPALFRDHFVEHVKHWSMKIPANIDSVFERMSSKHRYWIRRLPRALERDYPGQVRFEIFTRPDQVEDLFRDAEHIARKTYQRSLGVGFIDNEMNRRRLGLEAQKGWLHGEVLYVAEQPCAFWTASRYGRTIYLAFTGYDPKYRKYEPGTILFVRMIQNLINSDVDIMNFGSGEAFYKERFGDECWEEATMCIFAPTLRGFSLGLLRTSFRLSTRWADRLLNRLGLLQKVKTRWRRQAVSKH